MTSSAPGWRVVGGIKAVGTDALCLLALGVVCAVRLSTLEGALDLPPWDEADYLRRGLRLFSAGAGGRLPDPEWGPLYSVWYFALARLTATPVALFYLSYRVLIVLPAFAVYVCTRRVGAPAGVALAGALLFVLSSAAHILPRPSLLALVLLLAAFAAAARSRRFDLFALILALAALLASYARPEMFVSFAVASSGWAAALAMRARREVGAWRAAAFQVLTWAGAVGLLVAVMGNPMGNTSNRRLYAFCQHYALGEVTRSSLPFNPWGQCDAVMERSFGDVQSVGEAARANPTAFARHLTDNLVRYPLISLAVYGRSFAEGRGIHAGPWTARRLLQVVAVGTLMLWLLVALWRSRGGWLLDRLRAPSVLRAGLFLLAVLIPTALSAVLIHPREHYLVAQGMVIPLFAAAVLVSVQGHPTQRSRRAVGVASVVFALLALGVAAGLPLPVSERPGGLPNRSVVEALRGLAPASGSVRVLEAQGGYDAYVGSGFKRVSLADRQPHEAFDVFLKRARVDVVVLEPELLEHHLIRNDPAMKTFALTPERFGFREVAELSGDRRLAVRVQPPLPDRAAPPALSTSRRGAQTARP